VAAGLYVSLSAQMAAEKRLATIANNVANMNTPGYRAEGVHFSALVGPGAQGVAFASEGASCTALRARPLTATGNPLDIAIEGKSWFAVRTPDGIAYTRDGRMRMTPEGELRTMADQPVLDSGGAPAIVDPSGGAVQVGADGSLSQRGRSVGRIGLYLLPEGARLTRQEGGTVRADRPGTLVQDFTRDSVRQGFVEGSNVEPVLEMTRLIALQRAFEMAASAVSQTEDVTSDTIRQLGPS